MQPPLHGNTFGNLQCMTHVGVKTKYKITIIKYIIIIFYILYKSKR